LTRYRRTNASSPCCNTEATLERGELNAKFLKGMAKLAGIDLSGVSFKSDEGRAYALDLVEDWLSKQ